ncbi:MAG: aldehyde ferredoxin oxidoreductase family protein [Deltaproteobacteria bacterium]|nr:aldehyde ferredoxin oxidoreductase family protein [Deltaproteobacteria bacterium]
MAYGYLGRILKIDLSEGKAEVEERDETFFRSYLGGRGIGYYYLLKEVPAHIDPLSPENILVLATGVMTGAPLAASCRFTAIGKSPLTAVAGESEAGGFFGPELKKAGFDAVVLKGKSERPVYIWVSNGRAEIRDASGFADQGAKEVEEAIRKENGGRKCRIAQCGLAGMNLVRFANITNALRHYNGRNGLGAVMGSKNVRAVAAAGIGGIALHDAGGVKRLAKEYAATFRDNPLGKALYDHGTASLCESFSKAGALPVSNFRRSTLADSTPVSADTYKRVLQRRGKGCYACPIRCKPSIVLNHPAYGVDPAYGGPEYEAMAALGTNLDIVDLKAIAKANETCNRYCMDTISAGMTMALAFECFEKGVITRSDTDGMELRFGDPDLVIRLLEMTARREGFGDLLAEGLARLAAKFGVDKTSLDLSVKGQEVPMHDPRVKVGVGLGYAVATYGADHMNAAHDTLFTDGGSFSSESVKPLGIYMGMHPTQISNDKIRAYALLDGLWKVMDALGLCVFGFAPRGVMTLDQMLLSLNAVSGWNASLFELMKSAERATMMARAFNWREGFSPNDDRLPRRFFDPKPDGPGAGRRVFEYEDFQRAIGLFYEIIGCDPATGRPQRGKLLELGLDWVVGLLEEQGSGMGGERDSCGVCNV